MQNVTLYKREVEICSKIPPIVYWSMSNDEIANDRVIGNQDYSVPKNHIVSRNDDFRGIYEPVGDGAYAYCEIFTDGEGKPYLSSYDGPVPLQVAGSLNDDPEPSGPTMQDIAMFVATASLWQEETQDSGMTMR